MALLRPDPTFYPSPRLAMQGPTERLAYVAALNPPGSKLGFISSVSQPFCGDCTRARLSSDGVFYTCLFATRGVDLRTPMRAGAADDELQSLVRDTWHRREDRYSELRRFPPSEQPLRKIEMHYIGG